MLLNMEQEFSELDQTKLVCDIELKNGEQYYAAHFSMDTLANGSDRVVIRVQGLARTVFELIPFVAISRITVYEEE